MKKRNLKTLALNKKQISILDNKQLNGGMEKLVASDCTSQLSCFTTVCLTDIPMTTFCGLH